MPPRLRGTPSSTTPMNVSFALGVNDGLIFGESLETLALVTPPPSVSRAARLLGSGLHIHEPGGGEISSAHRYPDKYLGALAYYWA